MKKWSLPIGLMVSDVIRSFFSKPVTQRYPFVRKEAPERFRGKLVWDLTNCTGCQLCIRDCPAGAIELVVMDRVNKRFVMRFHADRCTYCSQCAVNCKFKCLSLSHEDWELASLTKDAFTIYYGKNEDVDAYKEQDSR